MKVENKLNKSVACLIISNFLFVSAYVFLGYHTLFIHKNSADELKNAVYLGFGIFNALQVGGVWLIKVIFREAGFNKFVICIFRALACILILSNNQILIITAYILFGLSSAAYFKKSRELIKFFVQDKQVSLSNPFIIFSITTNLAIIFMPLLGSYVLTVDRFKYIAIPLNIIMVLLSIWLLDNKETKTNLNEAKETPTVLIEELHFLDPFRIVMVLAPYMIMVTLPPIKIIEAGLESKYSSYLYTLNGVIVVLVQIFLANTKVYDFNIKKFDISCLLAFGCCLASYYAGYELFFIIFSVWSVIESYQIPGIEYLLFQKRNYSEKLLSRLLIVDSMVCLCGPIINTMVYNDL